MDKALFSSPTQPFICRACGNASLLPHEQRLIAASLLGLFVFAVFGRHLVDRFFDSLGELMVIVIFIATVVVAKFFFQLKKANEPLQVRAPRFSQKARVGIFLAFILFWFSLHLISLYWLRLHH
jgi:hypothetical protein